LLCHADMCRRFMLPLWPSWLTLCPISTFGARGDIDVADLHKYGYAAKGASVILYRNRGLRRHSSTSPPTGRRIYASPGVAGTRPGGPIAAAWPS